MGVVIYKHVKNPKNALIWCQMEIKMKFVYTNMIYVAYVILQYRYVVLMLLHCESITSLAATIIDTYVSISTSLYT